MIGLHHYLILSALLFSIGLLGVLTRRNTLLLLLAIELMLNAANLSFVAFASHLGDLSGQVFVFFVMIVAAAEVTVGLAIVVVMSRTLRTIQADEVRLLKW
ncbi:MAG: NADH-quinone oxidoreductase subunit NuoK [Candidatus Omnitrophica bacterium]|nr:NADH-quinone oxidoreductase subunit NuoK [Candidatus Omnitrophota bacterium]